MTDTNDNDFNSEELKIIHDTLAVSFAKAVETERADHELKKATAA